MDEPAKHGPAAVLKKQKTLGQHVRNIVLWLIILGAIVAAGIWFKKQSDKARNLRETALQELKQPQAMALEAVAADGGAKELLGDKIEDAGELARDGGGELDSTGTTIHFDVKGSKQKGHVTALTIKDKGTWQIASEIEVKGADGKSIKVPKPGEKPPDIDLGL